MDDDFAKSEEPAVRAEQRLGRTLAGKWRLQELLGVGGMAAVYRAEHRNQNRVAIKMLHTELSVDSAIRRRFLQEGYVGNSVRHPGVPRVLDDNVAEDGSAFLVMDLLEGRSLEAVLNERRTLDPAHVVVVADHVLDILEVAHARGVIHRDIKPDNIFLTESGQIKLLDFGIARLKSSSKGTTMGSFMGTPAFCPPEQARGRWSEVDGRTDLWALAATMFSAIAGRPVHRAETPTEQLALAVHTPAPSISEVVPELVPSLAAVIDEALAYDKRDRPADAAAFREALVAMVHELPRPPFDLADLAAAGSQISDTSQTVMAGSSRQRLVLDSSGGEAAGEQARTAAAGTRNLGSSEATQLGHAPGAGVSVGAGVANAGAGVADLGAANADEDEGSVPYGTMGPVTRTHPSLFAGRRWVAPALLAVATLLGVMGGIVWLALPSREPAAAGQAAEHPDEAAEREAPLWQNEKAQGEAAQGETTQGETAQQDEPSASQNDQASKKEHDEKARPATEAKDESGTAPSVSSSPSSDEPAAVPPPEPKAMALPASNPSPEPEAAPPPSESSSSSAPSNDTPAKPSGRRRELLRKRY